MNKYLILSLIFFKSYCFANVPGNDSAKSNKDHMKSSLYLPQGEKALLNEIIVIKPVEDHVFNLKAPNSCSKGRLISKNDSKIQCQTYIGGEDTFKIYVCDKKKTYCRIEKHKLEVEKPSGLWAWFQYYWRKNLNRSFWKAPKKTGISYNAPARGFIHNDVKRAIRLSRSKNKFILLYATQSTCPPCRLLKEMTLESDLFQELTKDYVKLQIDLDIEIAPERIKLLGIPRTPAFVLLNSNFEEIDFFNRPQSPLVLKRWLDKTSSYKVPIRKLSKKKSLSSKEKERLSLWYFNQNKMPEAKSYIDKNSTSWLKEVINIETDPNFKTLDIYLKNLKSNKSLCGDIPMRAPLNALSKLFETANSSNKFIALFNKYESVILSKTKKDPLGCAYLLSYLYSDMKYLVKETPMENKKEIFREKALENAMNFPTLPGVNKKTYLKLEIAYLKKDEKEKEKLLDKMRSLNKEDFTYDFWKSVEAFYEEKNYKKALREINKSLEIAKDNNWQKALKFKIEILTELNRKKEAQKLIEETLTRIDLPYFKSPKIHSFVQKLREQQVAL